jgi:hypothetical protein
MTRARASTLRVMNDPRIRLAHDSLTLLSAAERLQQGAGNRACATFVPTALDCIEQSLHALSRACEGAAHAFIPPGRDESVSQRYARAAADWPGAHGGAGPSHERQAQLVASLHDAGMALRTAGDCCARARDLLSATMETPADLDQRSAACTPA